MLQDATRLPTPRQGQLHGRVASAVAQASGRGVVPSLVACVPPWPSGDAGGLLNKAPRLRFALGPWILSIVLGPADRTRTSSVSGLASSSASAACTAPQVRSERGRAADRSGGEGHAVGGGHSSRCSCDRSETRRTSKQSGQRRDHVALGRGSASGPGRRRGQGRRRRGLERGRACRSPLPNTQACRAEDRRPGRAPRPARDLRQEKGSSASAL